MKPLPAILFALAITLVVGVSMFAIGSNALLNPNQAPILNSPGVTDVSAASLTTADQNSVDQQKLAQLQDLVNQYQQREKQLQTELSDAAAQLNQANQEVQQYQDVLTQLQQRGVIRITSDGQIMLRRGDN